MKIQMTMNVNKKNYKKEENMISTSKHLAIMKNHLIQVHIKIITVPCYQSINKSPLKKINIS